jgi:hypothetical protein
MILRVKTLWFLLILCCLHPSLLSAQKPDWKTYRNDRWGFQVEYPARWQHDEGVNHAGIAMWPDGQRVKGEPTTIEVGGRVNQPAWGKDENRQQTLKEVFSGKPDVLSKTAETKVVSTESTIFAGVPAIFATITYKISGRSWVAKTIDFIADDGVVYHLELRCPQAELSRLDPAFKRIASSFKVE